MPRLVGLPGHRKPIDCELFASARGAAKILHRGLGATAMGENGAISLWPTKDGGIRGLLSQFRQDVEDMSWGSPEFAARDIRRWLRMIRKPNARCAEIKRQILAGEYDFTREAE